MIKRFFCKNKQKKTEAEYELSQFKWLPPEELAVKSTVRENEIIIKKWLLKVMKNREMSLEIIQNKILHKLNKIAASENTISLQDAFDTIQKLQFHKHQLSHSGRNTFDQVDTSNFLSDDGHYIMITEQLNVRGFLVSIGLKDDVAWEAQEDLGINIRLQSAISEARNWVNKIVMSQGLLMYILAVMLPREINDYYLQIIEAIINKRISDIGSLLSIVMVLKRYRHGKYHISAIISKEDITNIVPRQISEAEKRHAEYRSRFMALYNIAKQAAAKINTEVSQEAAGLLVRLTFSYSPSLRPYMYLLVHYIAQNIIYLKGQLSMAVSYLRSLKTIYFNQLRFEQNCGLARYKVILKGKERPTEEDEID